MLLCPSGVTSVEGDCFHDSHVAAVDGRWRSSSGDHAISGQAASSLISGGPTRRLPDGTTIADGDFGLGGYLAIAKEGGEHWLWRTTYEGASRRFDFNDLGYLQRQNQHRLEADLAYRTLSPWGNTLETNTHLVATEERNLDGLVLGRRLKLSTQWQLRNRWSIYTAAHVRPAYFDDREVGDGTAIERARRIGYQLDVVTDPARRVSASWQSTTERLPEGINFDAGLTLGWRPVSQLELELIPEYLYTAGELRFAGPGQEPGTLKYPHLPLGTGPSELIAGCQRQRPFRQMRSQLGVVAR